MTDERDKVISDFNEISESIGHNEWDEHYMYPRMEKSPDNKIRFAYDYWELETGRQECSRYIDLEEAKKELKKLQGDQDED